MENSFQLFVRMQNCSKEDLKYYQNLTTAKDFCLANPEQKCLVVCLELFTFHTGDDEGNEMAVYMSLFADGCAAVVLSGDYGNIAKDKWAIEGSYSYLIPDCPKGITMNLMERGLTGTLDVNVPNIIQGNMKKFIGEYCSKFGINEIDHWCINPGGPVLQSA